MSNPCSNKTRAGRDIPVVRERRPNIMVNMTANRRHKGGKKKKTR